MGFSAILKSSITSPSYFVTAALNAPITSKSGLVGLISKGLIIGFSFALNTFITFSSSQFYRHTFINWHYLIRLIQQIFVRFPYALFVHYSPDRQVPHPSPAQGEYISSCGYLILGILNRRRNIVHIAEDIFLASCPALHIDFIFHLDKYY